MNALLTFRTHDAYQHGRGQLFRSVAQRDHLFLLPAIQVSLLRSLGAHHVRHAERPRIVLLIAQASLLLVVRLLLVGPDAALALAVGLLVFTAKVRHVCASDVCR